MPLLPLNIPPGVVKVGTEFQSSNRWLDANLVRWRSNSLRPVGGWRERKADAFAGITRSLFSWQDNGGDRWLAAGTADALYVMKQDDTVTDISPATLVSGNVDATVNTGFGGGVYGRGFYGTPTTSTGVYSEATTWSLSNWGEYLVACNPQDGELWEWQLNTANDAALIANAPTNNLGLIVTEERFLFALGADGDPRKIAWCDREDNTLWTPDATNEAGDIQLQTSGQIMTAVRTRGQTLIITDQDAHSATYQGPPFVYGFERVGSVCGAASRNAAVSVDPGVFWMGANGFFFYDGTSVREIPCEVHDRVFNDINKTQITKMWGISLADHGEIWWFYPSSDSLEPNKYVSYDYKENFWMVGEIDRTAGIDKGAFSLPMMISPDNDLYEHEIGLSHGGLTPFAESGPISIGSGDNVMSVTQLIPDELTQGDVTATFKTRFYPNGDELSYGPYSMANPTSVRFTGRQIRLRVEGARLADWRVGVMRVEAKPRGNR
jgi:hypothetical protein